MLLSGHSPPPLKANLANPAGVLTHSRPSALLWSGGGRLGMRKAGDEAAAAAELPLRKAASIRHGNRAEGLWIMGANCPMRGSDVVRVEVAGKLTGGGARCQGF